MVLPPKHNSTALFLVNMNEREKLNQKSYRGRRISLVYCHTTHIYCCIFWYIFYDRIYMELMYIYLLLYMPRISIWCDPRLHIRLLFILGELTKPGISSLLATSAVLASEVMRTCYLLKYASESRPNIHKGWLPSCATEFSTSFTIRASSLSHIWCAGRHTYYYYKQCLRTSFHIYAYNLYDTRQGRRIVNIKGISQMYVCSHIYVNIWLSQKSCWNCVYINCIELY